MSTTVRRVIGAFLLIASMGTATCMSLWNVSSGIADRDPPRIGSE